MDKINMCVERPGQGKRRIQNEPCLGLLLNVAGDGFKYPGRTHSRVQFEMPNRDLNDAPGRGQNWRTVRGLWVQEEWYQSLLWKPEKSPLLSVSGTDPHFTEQCAQPTSPPPPLRLLSIE